MTVYYNLTVRHIESHWKPYTLLLIILLFNFPAITDLVSDWARDDNYSHGFLIVPISIWLFWRRRTELEFPTRPAWQGGALFVFGCLGLIVATAASEYFTTRVSLILIISGMACFYLGWANFKKVWFSFVFLLFMVPIPAIIYHSATLPMQLFATHVTASILELLGVPCIRQGNVIQLPNYSLEVIEACSGLRSLVTLMALGALYAYLSLQGKVRQWMLFLATIPIAIVTNIVRILVTAIAAYAISTEVAESFLHDLSGLLVFVVALILTLLLGAALKWRRKAS